MSYRNIIKISIWISDVYQYLMINCISVEYWNSYHILGTNDSCFDCICIMYVRNESDMMKYDIVMSDQLYVCK